MRKQICDTCHTYQLKHRCRRPIGLHKIRSRKRASKLGELGQLGRGKERNEENEGRKQKKRSKEEEFLLSSRRKGNEGGVETIIEGKREKWAKRKASDGLAEEKGAEEEKIEEGARDTATLRSKPKPNPSPRPGHLGKPVKTVRFEELLGMGCRNREMIHGSL